MKTAEHTKFLIKRSAWLLITVFFAVFFLIAVVGSSIANDYSGAINGRLGLSEYVKVTAETDEESDTEYFKSDYYKEDGSYDNEKMRMNSRRVGLQAAVEGSVLLWNNEDALPLKDNAKVSLFGVSYINYVFTGTGSGQMPDHPVDGSLMMALRNNGVQVNPTLNARYLTLATKYVRTTNCGDRDLYTFGINEAPYDEIREAVAQSIDSYGDAAVMTVSRRAGEFVDITERVSEKFIDENNYLDLSETESNLLKQLVSLKEQKKIKKIILVINSANAMQFAHIAKDYKIDACLWAGQGGDSSFVQIADALTAKGDYVLSGRLSDTFVYYNRANPSYANFGDMTFTETAAGVPEGSQKNDVNTNNSKYVVYREGIYVGYRYYETRYEDAVLGRGNAEYPVGTGADGANWQYSKEVAFPFGYGLSYTEFKRGEPVFEDKGDVYEVSMEIENSGVLYDGKDVMQVYLQKPYTEYDVQNGIEKAAVELVGFAKTDKLRAGEKQTLTVTVDKERLKTYDSYGKRTYILEKGDYYLSVGNNAHDALNNILAHKGKSTADSMDYDGDAKRAFKIRIEEDDFEKYAVSSQTEAKITNLFDEADINIYEGTKDQKIAYLSRNDWKNTFPTAVRMKCTDPIMVQDMQYGKSVEVKEGDIMPTYGKVTAAEGELTLAMLMDLEFGDSKWQDLLNQMTVGEQQYLCSYGLSNMAGAESVNAPGAKGNDGPLGFRTDNNELKITFAFPSPVVTASTFNTALLERLGNAYGMEALHIEMDDESGQKHSVAYAPGANIHRSAYAGRNFEYYSEDSFLSGEMLAAQVKGMQNRGLIVMTKHFVLNDQESFRYGITTWANEQSIREIYCLPFEIAVTKSEMNGIMSSFNRIGCTWAGRHKGLLTDLLRGEWGFGGLVQTDSMGGNPLHMYHIDAKAGGLAAGNDLWMAGNGSETYFKGIEENPTVMLAMREACHRILYAQLHSSAMNGTDSSTRIVKVKVWWQHALLGLQIGAGIIFGLLVLVTVFAYVYCSKAWVSMCEKAAAKNSIPPKTKGGAFWRKHKYWIIPVIAVLVVAVILISVLVPIYGTKKTDEPHKPVAHVCSDVCAECGKCLDYECTKPQCADKCEGHIPHKTCAVCDKCIDYHCEEHADKCGTGKPVYTLEAEALSVQTDGVNMKTYTENGITYVGGMNDAPGNSITFFVRADENTVATLAVTVCKRPEETVFTNLVGVEVNGELYSSKATVDSTGTGGDTWTDFIEVRLGCIRLAKGMNTVKFTTLTATWISSYNFDNIKLYSDAAIMSDEDFVHYCPTCGKCMSLDCADHADKCGVSQSHTAYTSDASHAVLTAGVKGNSQINQKDGVWLIEQFNGNVGATAAFEFWADAAGPASLVIGSTRRGFDVRPTSVYDIAVNGEKIKSTAVLKSNGSDEWFTPVGLNLGCVKLKKGKNTVTVTVLYDGDVANNLSYISLLSDREIHIASTVEGRTPTCTAEGLSDGTACADCGKILAQQQPVPVTEHERKLVKTEAQHGVCALPGHPAYWQCGNCHELFSDEEGLHKTTEEEIFGSATHDCAPCTVCGKCTDDACTEPDCLDKCADGGKHRFSAGDAVLGAGTGGIHLGTGDYKGESVPIVEGMNGNDGANMTFTVNVRAGGKVRLIMTSSLIGWDVKFNDSYDVYVNGKRVEVSADLFIPKSADGNNNWTTLVDIDLGEIRLGAGANEIKIVAHGWGCTNLGHIFLETVNE